MYPRGATTFQKHLRVYMLIVVPTVVKFTFASITFFIRIILGLMAEVECQNLSSKTKVICMVQRAASEKQKRFQEVHCHFDYGLTH